MSDYKLLWLDDSIAKMNHYVDAIRQDERFLAVDVASTVDEALRFLRDNTYDLLLIDINMPHPNGIHFIRQALKISRNFVIVALSSYLYRKKYQNQLVAIDHPIVLMDKLIPSPVNEDFKDKFLKDLILLMEEDKKKLRSVNEQINIAKSIEEDPFLLSLDEWQSKNTIEHERLRQIAKEMVSDIVNREFEHGAIWILFLGSKKSFVVSAKREFDIPTDKEIMEQATMRNAVPFQFTAPMGVDDMWSTCKSGPEYNQGYPTVTLDIVDGKSMQMHFDTGSPMTFLSLEYLLTRGVIKELPVFFSNGNVNGCECEFVRFKEKVLLRSQPKGETTKLITLIGRAIRNWDEFILARKCEWKCEYAREEEHNGLCLFRQGLIGRNILHENPITLALDGKTKTTKIL
jgi:CheY-like chemotaxis protein